MRITFISPALNMGGGTKVISIYAKALKDMGHEITIVSPPRKKTSLKEKLKSLIKGKGYPKSKARCVYFDGLNINNHILNEVRTVSDMDVPDGDIVIATWWETAEWVNKLNNSKGAKVYFVQHHEVHKYLPIERCKETYRFPLHKIVIAKWLEKIMIEDYGDSYSDLVPNSVDHKQFFAPERNKQLKPTVGFLFSNSYYKGVDTTLLAINKLRQNFPQLRVISFGSALPADKKKFDDSIEFYHLPPQDKIRDLYSQCDVWITASITEGFNLPAMEAMACRTPVISTRAGWPEEAIITGENGVLVDVADVNALASGISEILSLKNDDWTRMSKNAYKTVENSSWLGSAKLFEKALHTACLRAKKGEVSGSCEQNVELK